MWIKIMKYNIILWMRNSKNNFLLKIKITENVKNS